jgi:hypothetical protein
VDIVLLALRLGIRSGDIVNLKIQNVDFKSNTIEFIQGKTCVPQRLEFLPELKEAIHAYMSAGRPKTEYPNLFISVRPPFRPITVMAVTSLITRCMKKSGISIGSRSYGGHALRMTLASELVSEKVPSDFLTSPMYYLDNNIFDIIGQRTQSGTVFSNIGMIHNMPYLKKYYLFGIKKSYATNNITSVYARYYNIQRACRRHQTVRNSVLFSRDVTILSA